MSKLDKNQTEVLKKSTIEQIDLVLKENEGLRLRGVILAFAGKTDDGKEHLAEVIIGLNNIETIGLCETIRVAALTSQKRVTIPSPSKPADEG